MRLMYIFILTSTDNWFNGCSSKDVEDYASHIPGNVVALDKEEDIVYKKGVLTHSAGVSSVKMMPHNMVV